VSFPLRKLSMVLLLVAGLVQPPAIAQPPDQIPAVAALARPALGMLITADPAGEVVVGGVLPGGAAADAGLQAGDRIVELAGQRLEASADARWTFERRISELDLEQPVSLVYRRGGVERYVELQPPPALLAGDARLQAAIGMAAPAGAAFLGTAEGVQVLPGPSRVIHALPLQLAPVSAELGRYFGVEDGVLVVASGETADRQGLQDGDVIQRIDGERVANVPEAMLRLMRRDGTNASIEVVRDYAPLMIDWRPPEPAPGMQVLPSVQSRAVIAD
jgi:S1-C subfamily serine protease